MLDDEYFTIPYITDKTPNSPASNQLPTQAKQNVRIIAIKGEEPITAQGSLDKINCHKTPRVESNVNISLWKKKSYQRTYIEEICSKLDQVRPVAPNIEVCIPKKTLTPNDIGVDLKGSQRKFLKEYLFVEHKRKKCHPSF